MKDIDYEKNTIKNITNILIMIFKWFCLIFSIIYAGVTISFLVISLVKGENLPNTILINLASFITMYTNDEILDLLNSVGRLRLSVGVIGYGFAISLSYGLMYNLFSKFKIVIKEIFKGNIYTKSNIKIINDAFPLTIFLAFASPIIVFCIINSTGILNYNYINVSGIIYICITYILKLVLESGFELEKNNKKYITELNNMKAEANELKMVNLKKKIEIKEQAKKEEKKPITKTEEKVSLKKNALKKAKLKQAKMTIEK